MLLHPPDELSHVVPGAHPQQSGELAVNRVLHDYVHHLAPGVHDGVELPLHLLRSVNTGHGALHAASPSAQEIPPGRGQDIRPSGPEQGHIAHDEGGGAHRPHGLLQRLGHGLPPGLRG